jgi:hypothetical protein
MVLQDYSEVLQSAAIFSFLFKDKLYATSDAFRCNYIQCITINKPIFSYYCFVILCLYASPPCIFDYHEVEIITFPSRTTSQGPCYAGCFNYIANKKISYVFFNVIERAESRNDLPTEESCDINN